MMVHFNLRDFPRFMKMWTNSNLTLKQHFLDMNLPYTTGERLDFSLPEQDYLRWL